MKDGESIAVTYLSRAMAHLGCEVTLLTMNTTKHYTDIQSLPDDYDHYKHIYFTDIDNNVKPLSAFFNLFTSDSYHISRFVSRPFEEKLIEVLQNHDFDVIQLETLYLAPYIETIKKYSNAVITMRAHNIEFEIWERITKNTTFLPKKWYLNYLTSKLKKYELEKLNDYDYLIAVSDRDLKKFKQLGYKNGAMATPIGLELSNYITVSESLRKTAPSICFIGALDWTPNREGLDWFLQNVWSKINAKFPQITFHIAGRNTPEDLKNSNIPNVVFHGEVPDAVDFINLHTIMVVPLFSGSGMRVKILEGMALKKNVITTTLGKEGIDAKHGEHLMIADSPDAFVEAISELFEFPEKSSLMGETAFEFVKEYYDHKVIAEKLIEKYQYLLDHPYHQNKILS